MAGTRTAPAVTGVVSSVNTTLHFIDASGDTFTENIVTLGIPLAADIEGWAAAYQLATQSSLWKVTQSSAWEGAADPDNAEVGQRNSVKDGINLLYKDIATLNTINARLIAPVPSTMQGNQDIPLVSDATFTALLLAYAILLPSYELNSAQYTERRERKNNPKIKV